MNLIDVEMVKVKPGQEEEFKKLRNEYKVRARSSNNILDVVVFNVVRDTLEQLPDGNIFKFPADNNELTVTVYRDSAASEAALQENLKKPRVRVNVRLHSLNSDQQPAGEEVLSTLSRGYPDDAFPAYP